MGEKRDSGSKDADNFGAEFGTDKRLAQRQAATRRNQAVQRNRRERKSRVDDRAMTNVPVVTTPTGGQPAQATLTAVSNTQQAPRQLVPDPGMMATSLGQDLMRSVANVTDQDTRNFGAEFGGINPITANVSPILALTRNAMNQGSGQAVPTTGNIGAVPTTTDIVNASIEQARANQGSGLASLTGDPMTDANIAGFQNTVTSPLASGATPLASPELDLGFEDVDDDDSFFPVTNQPQDITALNPNFLSRLPLVGDALYEGQINQLQQFASIPGSQYDYSTGSGTAQAGQGTLNLSPSGIVTYSGPRDGSYTGPFANLVNPPERPDKDVSDPCPPGFQLIGGVCRPTYDVTAPAAPAAPTPGSNFQMTPTAGFPTSFAPSTQATPVPLPDPFVLSPTGAAIGRRV